MRSLLRSARGRTILGLTLGVLFVPVLLGITACFDTPIGDPEQGWVDPRVTGVWISAEADDGVFNEASIWILEPYDARTWLVTVAGLSPDVAEPTDDGNGSAAASGEASGRSETESSSIEPGVEPVDDPQAADEDAANQPPPRLTSEQVDDVITAMKAGQLTCDELLVFKGWLTSIGKSRYLVLEPKHVLSSERGFGPELWWIFRVVLRDGAMELWMVDLPEGVKTRGEAESILAARANDPELFDPAGIMVPAPQSLYDDVARSLAHGTLSFEY